MRRVLSTSTPALLFLSTFALSLLLLAPSASAQKLIPPKREPPTKKSAEARQVRALFHGPDLQGKDGPFAKAGLRLARLYQGFTSASSKEERQAARENALATVSEGRVAVDAIASGNPTALLKDLEALGLRQGARAGRIVSGLLPIGALPSAARLPGLRFMRPSVPQNSIGDVTTKGDVAMRSDEARANNRAYGTGMKVGVISDAYNQKVDLGVDDADDDIESGDLPPTSKIQILYDPPLDDPKDEGRAMMQIIRDVAPNARQAFHSGFPGRAHMLDAIRDLAGARSDVIVDDLYFLSQPFFQDGAIAQIADSVAKAGIPYFSAAGNHARLSYSSDFRGVLVGDEARVFHDFHPHADTADIFQTIEVPAGDSVRISLQWTGPYASAGGQGADADIDIYIANDTLGVEQSSQDPNIGNDPTEVFQFTNDGTIDADRDGSADTVFFLAFELLEGSAPEHVKYIYFNDALSILEYDTKSPTSVGHANAKNVAAVGAAPYWKTPAFGTSPPRSEDFSSEGGVPIYFDENGNRLSSPKVRSKPDVVAPDRADNTFFGSDSDGDGFPNFFGTSAAAPHAAAVAALMLDKNPSLTPQDIYSILEESALDMDDPATAGFDAGFDFRTGQGLIQADEALRATEIQTRLYVDKEASGANSGASWTDAYRALQDAFDEANLHPSHSYEVWIAEGTYRPDFDLIDHTGDGNFDHTLGDRSESFSLFRDSVKIYGGFAGTETGPSERDPSANEVVLSGDISARGDTSDNSYHVVYLDGRSAGSITGATVLDGLTIACGNARGDFPNTMGGGLFCEGGGPGSNCSPALRNLLFRKNAAVFGGGLFINGSATQAKASLGATKSRGAQLPRSRTARGPGASGPASGALHVRAPGGASSTESPAAKSPKSFSALVLSGSEFNGNLAEEGGGALYNWAGGGSSSPLIRKTSFSGNEAAFGGAIYNDGENGTANLSLVYVELRDNLARKSGGAMYSFGGEMGEASPAILRSRALSNTADFGGAFYFDGTDGSARPTVASSLLSGNVADTSGGAMYNRGVGGTASPSLVNTTAAGNEALYGGALYNDARNGGSASPTVRNAILWANEASNGAQVQNSASGATPGISYSIVEGGRKGGIRESGSSTTYDEGSNVEAPPQFAEGSGPDGIWGTQDDDLRLQGPGSGDGPSPGIDAGTNAALDLDGDGASDIISDLGGESRRVGVDGVSNSGSGSAPLVDIGAYESSGEPLPVELTRLDATLEEETAVLTWTTASETGNAGFAVQRRGEGPNWAQVGFVEGAGSSTTPQSYRLVDADLPYAADSLTYRLRQVDADGTVSYSRAVTIERNAGEPRLMGTSPNPTRRQATLRYSVSGEQKVTIALYDVLGRRVRTVVNGTREGRTETTLDVSSLPSGVYYLRLTAGTNTETRRLTIVR